MIEADRLKNLSALCDDCSVEMPIFDITFKQPFIHGLDVILDDDLVVAGVFGINLSLNPQVPEGFKRQIRIDGVGAQLSQHRMVMHFPCPHRFPGPGRCARGCWFLPGDDAPRRLPGATAGRRGRSPSRGRRESRGCSRPSIACASSAAQMRSRAAIMAVLGAALGAQAGDRTQCR